MVLDTIRGRFGQQTFFIELSMLICSSKPSQMVGPKPILSLIFIIKSETPKSLYLRTVQHDVPNTLPSSSTPLNVAMLAGLNRNEQYKGLTVGYWERHPVSSFIPFQRV
jgi:hypothetical protein